MQKSYKVRGIFAVIIAICGIVGWFLASGVMDMLYDRYYNIPLFEILKPGSTLILLGFIAFAISFFLMQKPAGRILFICGTSLCGVAALLSLMTILNDYFIELAVLVLRHGAFDEPYILLFLGIIGSFSVCAIVTYVLVFVLLISKKQRNHSAYQVWMFVLSGFLTFILGIYFLWLLSELELSHLKDLYVLCANIYTCYFLLAPFFIIALMIPPYIRVNQPQAAPAMPIAPAIVPPVAPAPMPIPPVAPPFIQNPMPVTPVPVVLEKKKSESVKALADLKEMMDSGLITKEQFEAKRNDILDRM